MLKTLLACVAVAGRHDMEDVCNERLGGETRRRYLKKRLPEECCPSVKRACKVKSSPAYLQRCSRVYSCLAVESTGAIAVSLNNSGHFAPSITELCGA